MTKSSKSETPLPFAIYQSHLDMMARVIEGNCKLGMMMLEASQKSGEQVLANLPEQVNAAAPQLQDMIPSTDDMQSAATAVTKAMNEAAVRAIAHVAGRQEEANEDNAPVPSQPKRRYKPSISAAKTPAAAAKPKAAAKSPAKPSTKKSTRPSAAR